MFLTLGQAYEDGGEEREDVGLDEGYERLHGVHEQEHDAAEESQSRGHTQSHRGTQQNDAGERQEDSVACHHVGKETDHQGEGLGNHTDNLNNDQEGPDVEGLGEEYFLPVVLVAKQVDCYHGADSQEEGYIDITGHIAAEGDKSYQIGEEDEVEHREQVFGETLISVLAHISLDDIIVDHHGEHLHHTYKAAGGIALLVVLLIPAGGAEEYAHHEQYDYPDLTGGLGETQVDRAYGGTIGHLLVNLAVSLFVEEEALRQSHLMVVHDTHLEEPLTCALTADDDWQGKTIVLAFVGEEVPLVGVGEVLHHQFGDIDATFLLCLNLLCFGKRTERKKKCEDE